MARPLFIATTFLSAFLLFLLQPMVGRLLLPSLGGSAQVWTACLVFFQAALLVGYAAAHGLARFPSRLSRGAHLLLLAGGAVALPLASGRSLAAPSEGNLTVWLLGALTVIVGPPFVAMAGNAPTLQRWFRLTGDRARDNPYFLYSASNVGSLLGLFAYPLLVEPFVTLTTQRLLWSAGYALLVVLVAGCALAAGDGAAADSSRGDARAQVTPVGARQVLRWIALAFVPSSLTVGVTSYVSTELAPIPLLWVVPLALYLITFIRAFAGLTTTPEGRWVRLAALAAFPLAVWHATLTAPTWALVLLHFGAFYVIAMLCHSRLYLERPDARHLTAFYLWVAFGGALGGIFNGLVAPMVFDTAAEYPLVLIASAAAIGTALRPAHRLFDVWLPRVVVLLAVAWVFMTTAPSPSVALWVPAGQIARSALGRVRIRAVAAAVVALLFVKVTADGVGQRSFVARSFFAVHRVVDDYHPGYRALIHGATLHGMQSTDPALPLTPITYFAREGPIGQVFTALESRLRNANIAVIGLGAGELASYASPGQRWTFLEIDPEVEAIARKRFTYLPRAAAPVRVVLGDGRVSVARSSEPLDMIVIDAFSSDAIPVHLVTVEAFSSYLRRLEPDGVIAMNISNRFVDLERPLARLAARSGLAGIIQFDSPPVTHESPPSRLASMWVAMSRSENVLGPLLGDARWRRLRSDGGAAWTDEKADLLRTIRWQAAAALSVR